MPASIAIWSLSLVPVLAISIGNAWLQGLLPGLGGDGLRWLQLWSGLLVLCGLAHAAGFGDRYFARAQQAPDGRLAWPGTAVWLVTCGSLPWMTLPAAGALGPVAAVAFLLLFGVRRGGDFRRLSRWGRVLFWGAVLFGVFSASAFLYGVSPYRLSRILSDFAGPLDSEGRHYLHGLVLRVLGGARLLGEASTPLPLHFDRLKGAHLLEIAHARGSLPAALLAALLLLGWQRLFCWLRGTASGSLFSDPMRRLGLALVGLHGFATLTGCLWNFGIVRQPFGPGLAPLTSHAAWWVLSSALLWILTCAHRQRVLSTPESPGPRRSSWLSAAMMAGAVTTIAGGLLLAIDWAVAASVDHGQATFAARHASVAASPARRELADRDGKVIATSLPAFDLWLIPGKFWGVSLANPEGDSAGTVDRLTDDRRRERLLESLAEWPQLRDRIEGRLDRYGKSGIGPRILAWGIEPEVAGKIVGSGLAGLKLVPRPIRHYPQGGLFAHVLGFASLSDPAAGQEGLELVLRRIASGSGDGAGAALRLTLDPEVQRAAGDALVEGGAVHGAVGGALVVVEAATGKIRAMVSSPGFDPNDDSTYRNPYQPERILNRARLGFPVGDLLTPLLAAHLIETGRMRPETRLATGRPSLTGQAATNGLSPEARLSLAALAQALPVAELGDVVRHLGLGVPLRIDGVPGNVDQRPVDWAAWTPESSAQPGAFIQTSLLQITQAYLPLAHGGLLRPIRLLEDSPGSMSAAARVLSPDTVNAMRGILGLAAARDLRGPPAVSCASALAGQGTGSRDAQGGAVSAFVGIVPVGKPRWLFGVLLQHRQSHTEPQGSLVAPVVAKLLDKLCSAEPTERSPETAMSGYPGTGDRRSKQMDDLST